ncbi:MAG: hypothetical protein ACLT1O_05695 [Bifidobacterium pseudocatenulatum]
MGEPVHLEQVLYPVKNYGSAVTPFYTNLALWVGGFVLVAIYKLEVDRDEKIACTRHAKAIWAVGCCSSGRIPAAIIATISDLALGINASIRSVHPRRHFRLVRLREHHLRARRGVPAYRQGRRRDSGDYPDSGRGRPLPG